MKTSLHRLRMKSVIRMLSNFFSVAVMMLSYLQHKILLRNMHSLSGTYSESSQTFKMEIFAKIVTMINVL